MLKSLALLALCLTLLFPALPVRADTGPTQRLGTGIPTSIAASPDGKTLAVGSSIGVWLLDAATLTPNGFWDTGVWVNSVEYSTDGRYLKVNETVYDTVSGPPAGVEAGQVGWVNHRCTFDGRLCAKDFYHEYDPSVLVSTQIISMDTLVSIRILERSTKDVAWSTGGDRLYTVFYDWRRDKYVIKLWDVQNWHTMQELEVFVTNYPSRVLWSTDGSEVAAGRSVWTVDSAQIARTRDCGYWQQWQTFDCKWPVMTASPTYGYVYRRRPDNGAILAYVRPHHLSLYSAALSPDTHWLVTSGADTASQCSYDDVQYAFEYYCKTLTYSVKIWDFQSLSIRYHFPWRFSNVAFSPDGNLLIGRTGSGLEAWDWRNAQKLWESKDDGLGLAIGSSGNFIAAYSGSAIRIYRLATGESVATLTGHTASITDIAFGPDGTKVAASSLDGTILIWDVP